MFKDLGFKQTAIAAALVLVSAAGGYWLAPKATNSSSDGLPLMVQNQPVPDSAEQWQAWSEQAATPKLQSGEPQSRKAMDIQATVMAIVGQKTQFLQFAAAYPVALRATEAELARIIETLMAMESNPDSIGIARIFYVRFVNLNPQAAADHFWATVPESSTQYRRVMLNVYHEWAWIDMQGALDDIVSAAPLIFQERLLIYLLSDDHYNTNEALLALAERFSDRTRTAALLAGLDQEDNEQAFERLLAMQGNHDARRQGLFRLVRRWAEQDPQGALQRLRMMDSSADKDNLISNVISTWAQTEPEMALQAALSIESGSNFAFAALSTLARKDGLRAMNLVNQYKEQLDATVKNQIMQSWASSDPRAAASYIEQKNDINLNTGARQIAWHYTLQHPEEAYQWAERVGLLNDHNVASNMGNAIVQTDLNKAEALFDTLPPSASRNSLFTNIARQRSRVDLEGTYRWLQEHKAEAKFNDAQNSLMYEWSRRDPQSSAQVVMEMENNPNKSAHLSAIASNWYERSPSAAVGWLYDLPSGDLRDKTIASLAQHVSRQDIDQAMEMASEISNSQFKQSLIQRLNNQGQKR